MTSPLDAFCKGPFESGAASAPATLTLLPGVEALDLFRTSQIAGVWKDGRVVEAWVPRAVLGWEFYSLLWPQPTGTAPLKLAPGVELLGGRPPRGGIFSTILFAFISEGHSHGYGPELDALEQQFGTARGAGGRPRTVHASDKQCNNLSKTGHTITSRILVLCPTAVYRSSNELPVEQNWGLFIAPRSRSLVLLSRHRGRIDLHLAACFAIDAVFRLCEGLVAGVARLFGPFGTQDNVPALFGEKLDPLKFHSGITNAIVADHVNIQLDGRDDYLCYFNIRLSTFFLSNASNNLCFLTPLEAQQQRDISDGGVQGHRPRLVEPGPLYDLPRWTLRGHFTKDMREELLEYRSRVIPPPVADRGPGVAETLLNHFLGVRDVAAVGESWLSALSGCAEIQVGDGSVVMPAEQLYGQPHGQGAYQSIADGNAAAGGVVFGTPPPPPTSTDTHSAQRPMEEKLIGPGSLAGMTAADFLSEEESGGRGAAASSSGGVRQQGGREQDQADLFDSQTRGVIADGSGGENRRDHS